MLKKIYFTMRLKCLYFTPKIQLLFQLGIVLFQVAVSLIQAFAWVFCFAILCSYVPALRPLRQQAFLLSFPQTQPSRLTQRLAEVSTGWGARTSAREPCRLLLTQVCRLQISLRQGMKTDSGTLMCLCEKTDSDIRACINTLQVECSGFHIRHPVQVWRCCLMGFLLVCSCAVPSRTRPEAGRPQDHPVCVSGTKRPEQRLVSPVAGNLPATANKTVRVDDAGMFVSS